MANHAHVKYLVQLHLGYISCTNRRVCCSIVLFIHSGWLVGYNALSYIAS